MKPFNRALRRTKGWNDKMRLSFFFTAGTIFDTTFSIPTALLSHPCLVFPHLLVEVLSSLPQLNLFISPIIIDSFDSLCFERDQDESFVFPGGELHIMHPIFAINLYLTQIPLLNLQLMLLLNIVLLQLNLGDFRAVEVVEWVAVCVKRLNFLLYRHVDLLHVRQLHLFGVAVHATFRVVV